MTKRIIVGISGASGIVYGVRALEMLAQSGVETHLVMSKSAELTLHYELDMSTDDVKALASEVHAIKKCRRFNRQWFFHHRWYACRPLLNSHHVRNCHRGDLYIVDARS